MVSGIVIGAGVIAATIATGGAAAPLAAGLATVQASSVVGAVGVSGAAAATGAAATAAAGSAAAIGTAAASGAAAAAVTGGCVATGAVAGATAATTTAVIGAAPAIGTAAAVAATNPIGWIILGASAESDGLSWDCWKPVIRYTGRDVAPPVLADILSHESVVSKTETSTGWRVTNKWDEKFNIDYVVLPGGLLAAHAERAD